MEQQVRLKKVFGDVFFTATRTQAGDILHVEWYGTQSVETVKEGGYKMLEMMKEQPCAKLLNSNKNVVGSWDMALDWAEKVWTPQMKAAGLRYMAQVVPTSIYATLTIESLIQRIDREFMIRIFEDEEEAEDWLCSVTG
ncbi:hypothetical protein H9Q13_13175 [Pontibacter sp. JH31]|uniref:STAS/SEC14 domain-containing protein n=1 Tax=Pontibacter aquaedesilientis TaxID=2766980 RepID=A0ABR7XIM6_9BACT|nr:hypothetical protein [Pontibacter aquaedesilientis]MBD1398121.1 hypothetical protein [Pontibacter aquaedesilientis]